MIRRLIIMLLLTATIVAGVAAHWLWQDWQRFETQPLQLPADSVEFEVAPGSGSFAVIQQFIGKGWWQPTRSWRWRLHREPQWSDIQAGEYRLRAGMTLVDALKLFRSGEVIKRHVSFVEGWNWRQVRAALAGAEKLQQKLPALTDADLLRELGIDASHPEGQFFPDTYQYTARMSDLDILRRAHAALTQQLDSAWAMRKDGLPLKSSYQALILASIVEKETGVPEERPRIAGVFVQRLNTGMRLQTDPTVIYGLGEKFDGNLRKIDLQTDTPYNSYTRAGLPPTPIAMVGAAAIRAATQPEITGDVYFVARGDGSHVFSRTLDEHNRAVRQFQLKRR